MEGGNAAFKALKRTPPSLMTKQLLINKQTTQNAPLDAVLQHARRELCRHVVDVDERPQALGAALRGGRRREAAAHPRAVVEHFGVLFWVLFLERERAKERIKTAMAAPCQRKKNTQPKKTHSAAWPAAAARRRRAASSRAQSSPPGTGRSRAGRRRGRCTGWGTSARSPRRTRAPTGRPCCSRSCCCLVCGEGG